MTYQELNNVCWEWYEKVMTGKIEKTKEVKEIFARYLKEKPETMIEYQERMHKQYVASGYDLFGVKEERRERY